MNYTITLDLDIGDTVYAEDKRYEVVAIEVVRTADLYGIPKNTVNVTVQYTSNSKRTFRRPYFRNTEEQRAFLEASLKELNS